MNGTLEVWWIITRYLSVYTWLNTISLSCRAPWWLSKINHENGDTKIRLQILGIKFEQQKALVVGWGGWECGLIGHSLQVYTKISLKNLQKNIIHIIEKQITSGYFYHGTWKIIILHFFNYTKIQIYGANNKRVLLLPSSTSVSV